MPTSRFVRATGALVVVVAVVAVLSFFARAQSETLTIQGNVVVQGQLTVGAARVVVPVFGNCSGGSESCTANAACPAGMTVVTGWFYWIVPDGTNAAYGICANGSGACTAGLSSCSARTGGGGTCSKPGWARQTALVAISCGN
jgi:hypothetical protein